MTANMREALEAAKEFIAEGIETDGPTEAEHSIYARGLVAKIDAALSAVPAPVSEDLENHVALPVANESAVPQQPPIELLTACIAPVGTEVADVNFVLDGLEFHSADKEAQRKFIASFRQQIWGCAAHDGWDAAKKHTKAVEEIDSLEAAPSQRGSPISRTEGGWRLDPKTVEMCARMAHGFGIGRERASYGGSDIAVTIRSLLDQSRKQCAECDCKNPPHDCNWIAADPEESIRTRLDDQHVKSSGGVRTSTGKE